MGFYPRPTMETTKNVTRTGHRSRCTNTHAHYDTWAPPRPTGLARGITAFNSGRHQQHSTVDKAICSLLSWGTWCKEVKRNVGVQDQRVDGGSSLHEHNSQKNRAKCADMEMRELTGLGLRQDHHLVLGQIPFLCVNSETLCSACCLFSRWAPTMPTGPSFKGLFEAIQKLSAANTGP